MSLGTLDIFIIHSSLVTIHYNNQNRSETDHISSFSGADEKSKHSVIHKTAASGHQNLKEIRHWNCA